MWLKVLPIIISGIAVLFTFFTWRERASKDRRDLFLKIQERLVDIDLQRGRRILYQAIQSQEDVQTLFLESPDLYDLANRALAMLEIAAFYAERGYIDKSLFMEEWGGMYARIFEPACVFISERARHDPYYTQWPHFRRLADEARKSLVT